MKKKKKEIFYNPIDGSAPLSIYWYDGPKGDAVEADNEKGVGFFLPSGELLGVIFDDVVERKDRQTLLFGPCSVTIEVNKGSVKVAELKSSEKSKSA
jgi:hypothetical protein